MLISISCLISFLESTNNAKISDQIAQNFMGQGRNICAWQDLMSQKQHINISHKHSIHSGIKSFNDS